MSLYRISDLRRQHRSGPRSTLYTPSAFNVSGLPTSVSWNAGVMKSSPGPLLIKMAKWIQNQSRYTIAGKTIKPRKRAPKCFPMWFCEG